MLKFLAFRSFLVAIQDYYPFVRGSWGATFKGIVFFGTKMSKSSKFLNYIADLWMTNGWKVWIWCEELGE